jgi:uncharacterized membrane protein
MNEEILVILFGVLVAVAGYICGIVALIMNFVLRGRLRRLERRIETLSDAPPRQRVAEVAPPFAKPEPPPTPGIPKPTPSAEAVSAAVPPPPPPVRPAPLEAKQERASLEWKLGTRWIIWLGAIMFLGGVAFALKYSYDNSLIGPEGRLAIGVFWGVAAVVAGEWFRRKDWRIPFQAFTGGGFSIFYICIYFAFQVYEFTGQGLSMSLAVLVTVLAVAVAVAHNALPIAILAVLGGYASPLLLSTGENRPHMLFTYVALLNLVALGSAWFRRWRALDLVCFVGTITIYQTWYLKFYEYPDQLVPALTYTTLFYLMFLAAPTLYSLVRRMPEGADGLTLIVLNALFSVYCYYNVLFEPYRYALGFVVLGQAFVVFLLFRVWS